MLGILRKSAQSTVIQIMVLAIIVVFAFWGVGTNLMNKRNSIAVVNGEEVTMQNFQKSYDRAVEHYRQQLGGSIPRGFLKGLGLKRRVLAQLIQGMLLRQGGKEMGLSVSKLAIRENVEGIDAFQQNGHFDMNRYRDILSRNRTTPTSFENGLSNDLLTRRVDEVVRGFAMVTDIEVQSRLDFLNEEIKLALVSFNSKDFEGKVKVNDGDLASWYDLHKNEYRSEPEIRLKYLFFNVQDDLKKVNPTDDEIKGRYESEKAKYQIPEERHARHILFRVDKTDGQQIREEKKKKADKVLKLVKGGKDFAAAAKEYSEGPTGPNGGDLGFFSRGSMVKPFDDAVFRLQPGEISGVIQSQFGFHIIKLEEVRPARTRSYDEVKGEIAAAMKEQDAKGMAFKRVSKAYEDIIRSGSIEKYGKNSGGIIETPYFAKSSPPASIVSDPKFLQTAFSLKKGELSSIVELKNGYAILFVDDIREPAVPELTAVRARVVVDYKKEKSVDLARNAALALLKEAREKKGLALTATGPDKLKESGYLKRIPSGNQNDVPPQVIRQAFTLSLKKNLPDQPVDVNHTFYVFQLLDRRQGEEKADKSKRRKFKNQLLVLNQNRLLTDWLSYMQSKSDIWTQDQMLKE